MLVLVLFLLTYIFYRVASGGASSPAQSSSNLNKQILQLRKENSSLKSEIEELRVKLKKSSEKAPEKAAAADDGGKYIKYYFCEIFILGHPKAVVQILKKNEQTSEHERCKRKKS